MAHNSRPTTPLRRYSGFSNVSEDEEDTKTPLETTLFSRFVDLNDGFAQLETNMQRMQQVHESITCFNESFSSFLYGIQMNAWCVEFPEAPTSGSFERYSQRLAELAQEKEVREQQEREEIERQRQLELERQRELEIAREKLISEQQQKQQELHKQQHPRYPTRSTATEKRALKRPTDYTPGRPTYGKPPQSKLKSTNGTSRIPTRPSWK